MFLQVIVTRSDSGAGTSIITAFNMTDTSVESAWEEIKQCRTFFNVFSFFFYIYVIIKRCSILQYSQRQLYKGHVRMKKIALGLMKGDHTPRESQRSNQKET